ncbi:MAG: hypothetical protein ACI8XV_001459 [Arenicella sp.]|jgi:hypothetical protein
MFIKTTMCLVLLFVLASVSPAHARSTKLQAPLSFKVTNSSSIELLDRAVGGALAEKQWTQETVTNSMPRNMHAVLVIGGHKIWSEIEYDLKQITLSYLDSENMNYREKKGQQYIHPSYHKWSQALFDQIKQNMALGELYIPTKTPSKPSNITNPAPNDAFSKFTHFRLEDATLEESYQSNKGNIRSKENFIYNLNLSLKPKLEEWTKENSLTKRLLVIKPHINGIRFVGGGARFWGSFVPGIGGAVAGRSWIYLTATFIDGSTGEIIATPELYRLGATTSRIGSGAKHDYIMIERMAVDFARYIENNYNSPVGGGTLPPSNVRAKGQGNDTEESAASNNLLSALHSADSNTMRVAAKAIGSQQLYNDRDVILALVAVLRRELDIGSTDKSRSKDRNLVDGLAWCVKNLGNSDDPQARSVLVEIAASSLSSKIKKHAVTALKKLSLKDLPVR